MAMAPTEALRISPRLKNALVADLVMDDLSKDGDHWLLERISDEREITEHFGRQLGMTSTYGPGGIHDTLLLIIREVDVLVNSWPPPHDIKVCRALAHEATKHLNPVEVYATLLAGPSQWRGMKIEPGCRVDRLASHMKPLLEKALAAELHRVVARWVQWDIRKLRERRKEALERVATARAKAESEAAGPRLPRQRLTGRDRIDRLTPPYRPPGRT